MPAIYNDQNANNENRPAPSLKKIGKRVHSKYIKNSRTVQSIRLLTQQLQTIHNGGSITRASTNGDSPSMTKINAGSITKQSANMATLSNMPNSSNYKCNKILTANNGCFQLQLQSGQSKAQFKCFEQEQVLQSSPALLTLLKSRQLDNDVESDDEQMAMGIEYMRFQLIDAVIRNNDNAHKGAGHHSEQVNSKSDEVFGPEVQMRVDGLH